MPASSSPLGGAERVSELFGRALELSAAERSAFLDDVCAREPELRAEVESLLRAHEGANRFHLLVASRGEDAPSTRMARQELGRLGRSE